MFVDGAWTGTADFMVAGTYAIEFHVVWEGARRWQLVHGVTPSTFEVGDGIDGTVEVRATEAEIAAAIAKLPRDG